MPLCTTIPGYKPHTYRIMFACLVCKAVRPCVAQEVRFSVQRDHYGNDRKTRFYNLVDVSEAWAPKVYPQGYARGCLSLGRCGACGATQTKGGGHPIVGREIIAHITDHKCDVRCTEAKGHKCECNCGGVNHGAGWLGSFVVG
jgi:hypothetical protein